ncbi:hypothetical protein [Neisseria wadsworthii]|uniref:Uncharacterized protein n=1 Tax=Neisseria wadsworthii 9715 TaxID=1030841 RepID=G4CMW7_9NEIS|nr:hypothetical protein [Neisseria wadsworthii]EGZ50945.1 hypothetical protein HMPREF9370_0426 [Neisseria wadsworthii 9715]QMT36431.1 hypothetical protein H3L96_04195 [Neisseria wadsworthii]
MEDEITLIKSREWPAKFLNVDESYIAITRPEDLGGFLYAKSLKPNQQIDFNKLDIACTDITWEGWNYLLPILQRRYFDNLPNEMEDCLLSFFWFLETDNNLSNLLVYLDSDDLKNFKDWISFILFSGKDNNSFIIENELLSILERM